VALHSNLHWPLSNPNLYWPLSDKLPPTHCRLCFGHWCHVQRLPAVSRGLELFLFPVARSSDLEPVVYKMYRLPFGASFSPFVAIHTVRQIIGGVGDDKMTEMMNDGFTSTIIWVRQRAWWKPCNKRPLWRRDWPRPIWIYIVGSLTPKKLWEGLTEDTSVRR
jgi:hypothetical protein